jgi:hypothetical protein
MIDEPDTIHAETGHPTRPGWGAVLVAPYIAPFVPSRAGRALGRARGWQIVNALVLFLFILIADITFFTVWDKTKEADWRPYVTEGTTQPVEDWQYRVVNRTWAEAWEAASDPAGPLGFWWLALWLLLYFVIAVLLLSFLVVPDVYCGGRVRRTWARNLRTVWVFGAVIMLLGSITSTWTISRSHVHLQRYELEEVEHPWAHSDLDELMSVGLLLGGFAWSWATVVRVARGANSHVVMPEREPRCSECGYSLRHIPASGLCPECGTQAAGPGGLLTREGLAWQQVSGRESRALWRTTLALLRPGAAYRAMRVHSPGKSGRDFMITHFLLVVLAAGIVVFLYTVWGEYGSVDALEVILPVCLLSLAGWLGYRLVAAVAVGLAARGRDEWGTRALCGVVPYETVWLWAFLLLDGGFAIAEALTPEWWSFWLEMVGVDGYKAEEAFVYFVFACNVALAVLWLWRYRVAWRAVRYANF